MVVGGCWLLLVVVRCCCWLLLVVEKAGESLAFFLRQQIRFTPETFGQLPFSVGSNGVGIPPFDFGRDGAHNEATHTSYVDA